MMYDYYTAGGMVKTADFEKKTFLVDPQINYDSVSSSARISSNKQKTLPEVARPDVLARWKKDGGAIGRAIRRGEFDILREAIREMKKRSI